MAEVFFVGLTSPSSPRPTGLLSLRENSEKPQDWTTTIYFKCFPPDQPQRLGFPGFPVKLVGVDTLHAAFLNESRTRGRVQQTYRKSGSPIFFVPRTLWRTWGTRPVLRLFEVFTHPLKPSSFAAFTARLKRLRKDSLSEGYGL
jgi:hypothetical protein